MSDNTYPSHLFIFLTLVVFVPMACTLTAVSTKVKKNCKAFVLINVFIVLYLYDLVKKRFIIFSLHLVKFSIKSMLSMFMYYV